MELQEEFSQDTVTLTSVYVSSAHLFPCLKATSQQWTEYICYTDREKYEDMAVIYRLERRTWSPRVEPQGTLCVFE